MSRGQKPRRTVEDPNTVAPVPPVPVSGRVEARTPRPDTAFLDFVGMTVAFVAALFVVAFGPQWLTYLITH